MRSLVIGKFYPPTNGHKYLIDTAIAESEKVYIIICEKKTEVPNGTLRLKWINEWYHNNKNVHIQLIEDIYNDDSNSQLWAKLTIEWLSFIPDCVFTSESYGDNFVKFLGNGCKHRLVDINRNTIPISGTQIRNDPLNHLDYLQYNVRSYYVMRIIIVGAESTGKTTLINKLSEMFKVTTIPEYGRIFAENKPQNMNEWVWTTEEFVQIANLQIQAEIQATKNNKFIICDTDAFAASIWHQRYVGTISEEVERIYKNYSKSVNKQIYLLTTNDVPFVQDGYRDGEHIRDSMYDEFVKKLNDEHKHYHILNGTYDERFNKACEIIKNLI